MTPSRSSARRGAGKSEAATRAASDAKPARAGRSGGATAAGVGTAGPAVGAGAAAAAPVGTIQRTPAEIERDQNSEKERERAAKGETKPSHQRRNLSQGVLYEGKHYGPGSNVEVPDGLARNIDLAHVSPDASREAMRAVRGEGQEDDQDEQGKQIARHNEGRAAAVAKHQKSDAFAKVAEPKKK